MKIHTFELPKEQRSKIYPFRKIAPRLIAEHPDCEIGEILELPENLAIRYWREGLVEPLLESDAPEPVVNRLNFNRELAACRAELSDQGRRDRNRGRTIRLILKKSVIIQDEEGIQIGQSFLRTPKEARPLIVDNGDGPIAELAPGQILPEPLDLAKQAPNTYAFFDPVNDFMAFRPHEKSVYQA